MGKHWIKVVESNSTYRPWFGDYGSREEAEQAAREAVRGCLKGEGRVMLYDVDPRIVLDPEPILVLQA